RREETIRVNHIHSVSTQRIDKPLDLLAVPAASQVTVMPVFITAIIRICEQLGFLPFSTGSFELQSPLEAFGFEPAGTLVSVRRECACLRFTDDDDDLDVGEVTRHRVGYGGGKQVVAAGFEGHRLRFAIAPGLPLCQKAQWEMCAIPPH